MLDEALLDSPDALTRADTADLLRGAAEAGARVRTAARQATEAGLAELRPEGRPRGVLVAGPGPVTGCVADLLGALGHGSAPVTLIRPTGELADPEALRWTLPGWTGRLDLLVVTTPTGAEPGLTSLIEQAYRHDCTVVAVAPEGSPVAEAAEQARGLALPPANGPRTPATPAPPAAPATVWALLTPLIVLSDRLQLFPAPPPAVQSLAACLDRVAERCGPAVATYDNPAKTLAAELAGALPLLWSEGRLAGAVARHGAAGLTALAGRPALAAELPEALTAHEALLAGAFAAGADPEDFFRDRVEEPETLRARVVLLREGPPAAHSATAAARELALTHDTALSELEPSEDNGALETAAELIAVSDFAAAYLALADGADRAS